MERKLSNDLELCLEVVKNIDHQKNTKAFNKPIYLKAFYFLCKIIGPSKRNKKLNLRQSTAKTDCKILLESCYGKKPNICLPKILQTELMTKR